MELLVTKGLRGLEPADEESANAFKRIKLGSQFLITVRRPRNLQHHKRFRALLNTVWAACGNWETVEELHDEIKFRTGHVERRRIVDHQTGEVLGEIVRPLSTSFSQMDQFEFEAYYNRAIETICNEIVPGIDIADLRATVLEQLR